MELLVAPLLQEYIVPPLAVSVVESCRQIVSLRILREVVPIPYIEIVLEVESAQPATEIWSVTVKVETGLTQILSDVLPLLQRYFPPPPPINKVLSPAHIVSGIALIVAVDGDTTVTV